MWPSMLVLSLFLFLGNCPWINAQNPTYLRNCHGKINKESLQRGLINTVAKTVISHILKSCTDLCVSDSDVGKWTYMIKHAMESGQCVSQVLYNIEDKFKDSSCASRETSKTEESFQCTLVEARQSNGEIVDLAGCYSYWYIEGESIMLKGNMTIEDTTEIMKQHPKIEGTNENESKSSGHRESNILKGNMTTEDKTNITKEHPKKEGSNENDWRSWGRPKI